MDAPPEKVWALVSDVTRIGEFSPETFEARWTRGSTGPEVGASFKGHVKRNGVGPTYWSPCQVTEVRAERGLRVRGRHRRRDASTTGATGWSPTGDRHPGHRVLPARADAATCALYWLLLGQLRGRTNEKRHAHHAGADEGGGRGMT